MNRLPNALTMSRIVAVPLLVGAFYVEGTAGQWLCLGIFAAASVTDFFDGYLARQLGAQSEFGRFLDPIADKLIVAAALLMLVAFDRAPALPALIILGREILISGLREFLAGAHLVLHVTRIAKAKTTLQMIAIGFLIVDQAAPAALHAPLVGTIGLWIAAALTVYTGYDYLRTGLVEIFRRDREDARAAE